MMYGTQELTNLGLASFKQGIPSLAYPAFVSSRTGAKRQDEVKSRFKGGNPHSLIVESLISEAGGFVACCAGFGMDLGVLIKFHPEAHLL